VVGYARELNGMSKPAFWPGFNWRVLAHKRVKPLRSGYTEETWEYGAGERWNDRVNTLEGNWELDELVIDDWFHIEQMDTRVWWMRIGNQDVCKVVLVTVDRDGTAKVTVEDE
jgi:hypothetical protein